MHTNLSSALHNWIPYKLSVLDGMPYCYWLYTGYQRYTAPFFDETISQCRSLPENSSPYRSISSLDVLPAWGAAIETTPPAAFIFHVSRCGSTLIAQLLGLDEQHIVLAETPFLDQLLRLPYQQDNIDTSLIASAIPAAVQLYGYKRRGDEKHLFIKTDSWHFCFYRQLRQLFPAVPFVLLYRSPAEVIRSQRRRRGMQSVQGVIEPALFGFDKQAIAALSLDDYMAKVLEYYFTTMLAITGSDPLALLVNYHEPVLEIMQKIAAFTGLTLRESDLQAMQERSRYHAKYPEQVFQEPVSAAPLPDSIFPVMDLYNRLEAIRKGL